MKYNVHCRSGSSSGISGINKCDGSSLPTSSSVRIIPKAEPEKKPTLYRDPTGGQAKDRLLVKGNNKYAIPLNILTLVGLGAVFTL